MSIDLGRRVAKLNYGDPFTAYTGVTITSPDSEDKFTAGNDSGRILEVEIPWASQKMADNLLAQFSGVRHQPFTATGAILDPSAELGDAVTVDGVTGIMYRRDQRFGSLYRADISAPGDEEINHEIPYYPPIQRAVTRFGSVARGAASLAAQSMKRQDGIEEDFKELTATVTDVQAGMKAYVKNDVFNSYKESVAQMFAEVNEEDENIRSELTLHASSIEGLEEASAALMTRVSGAETALEMQSQSLDDLQTARTELAARVDGAEASLEQKADSKTVESLNGRVSSVETAQNSLTARVSSAESSLSQKAEKSTVSDLSGRVDTVETAQTSLTSRVGTVEASLEQKAEKKTVEALDGRVETVETAQTELVARVDGAVASIELNAQNINGVASSVATIEADVVELKGRVDLTGTLSISDGRLRCEKSIYTPANVFANKFWSDSAEIRLGSNDYVPTKITSTTGAVLALGAA